MYYRYVWQELRRRPNRTLVNILGIAVGVALFISINTVANAYKTATAQPFKNLGADLVVQRAESKMTATKTVSTTMRGIKLPFSNQLLSMEDLATLAQLPGVAGVAGSLLLWEFVPKGFQTIMGLDTTKDDLGPMKIKTWIKEGRFLNETKEVVVEKHFAKFHKIRVGDQLQVSGHEFKVIGLVEIKEGSQLAAANLYMSLKDAQALLSGESKPINLVFLSLGDPGRVAEIKSEITSNLTGVVVSSSDSFLELMGGISVISSRFAFILSVMALVGTILLIVKTMTSSLVERAQEIGVLKAVGWTSRDVKKQLMGEATLQCLLGGVVGLLLGYLLSFVLGFLSLSITIPWDLNPLPAAARTSEISQQVVNLPVQFSWSLTAGSLAISLLAGLLTAYFIGRKASQMKPEVILRQI